MEVLEFECPSCGGIVYYEKRNRWAYELKCDLNTPCLKCQGEIDELPSKPTDTTSTEQSGDEDDGEESPWAEFRRYKRDVWRRTEQKPLSELENSHRRGFRGYHLHHLVPVWVCFKNDIRPERAASLENLRFIPSERNIELGHHTLLPRGKELLQRWRGDNR